jgi:CRP-like cAMP-binding protein
MLNYSDPLRTSQKSLQAIARQAQYLSELPSHETLRLILAGTVEKFPSEYQILEEGSQIEQVYLVLQGLVSVGLYSDSHPALWLYVSGPGTLVDACALLEPPVSPVSIRTLTDTEVLAIPREAFVDAVRRESSVGYEILLNLSNRLALINNVTLKEFAQEYPGPSPN